MGDETSPGEGELDRDEKSRDRPEDSGADDGVRKTVDEDWKAEARREGERLERKLKDRAEGEEARDLPPPDFMHLVSGMAAQVLMQLGEIENPMQGSRAVDLPAARYSIDVLDMLVEKTKGNLTEDEDRYVRAALHDLRMRFVEAAGPPSGQRRQPDQGEASPGSGG